MCRDRGSPYYTSSSYIGISSGDHGRRPRSSEPRKLCCDCASLSISFLSSYLHKILIVFNMSENRFGVEEASLGVGLFL